MTFATPSVFRDMINTARQHQMKFTTLKFVAYGGAPCPMLLALEMKEVLNVKRLVVSVKKTFLACEPTGPIKSV
jgi:hypothetical protein